MNLYTNFVLNTLLRVVILISCIVIIILMSWYMSYNFADNFTVAERKQLMHPEEYNHEEQWQFLLAIACFLAFAILLLQCLGCLATIKRAKGRLDTPQKVRMMKIGVRVMNAFGALFSFICLITVTIRLAGIFRYDPTCGIYECEFRNRLIVVAALYFINTILFGALILISMHHHQHFHIVKTAEGTALMETGGSHVVTTHVYKH